MNEVLERIWDEAYSTWRFRWIGVGAAALICLTGWSVVFALPDRYEAYASVFVDTRTALRPVLQGLTVEQDVNVQLNYVRQSLLSGERLERIARQSGVLPENETDPIKIARALDEFGKRISLNVRNASPSGREAEREAGSIYSFSYGDEDRKRSLRVTETVVNAFVEETLGGKREGTENAQKFMETELKDLEQRLRDSEAKLAAFKKANVGLMPTEQGGYFAQLQAASDAADNLQNSLRTAQARRAELARQLRGDTVVGAAAMPAAGGAAGTDTISRINEAQARLDELLLKYTDKHPYVTAARSTLDDLKARREQEVERLRQGDASAAASSGVSNNPVYQSIQQQQNQVDVEIASLRGQLAHQQAKAADLRKRLDVGPQVDAEYAGLTRDNEVLQTRYRALLENYEKAQLGERADNAGSVRFEIVQPATSPFTPVSPNRKLLLVGILVVGLAAGAGLAFLMHMVRPVVTSIRNLTELTELPVLGVVSPAFPREMAVRARGQILRFAAAGGMLVLAFAGALVMNALGLRLGGGAS